MRQYFVMGLLIMFGAIIGAVIVLKRDANNAQTTLMLATINKVMGEALADKNCQVYTIKDGEDTAIRVECTNGKVYQGQVAKFPFDNNQNPK